MTHPAASPAPRLGPVEGGGHRSGPSASDPPAPRPAAGPGNCSPPTARPRPPPPPPPGVSFRCPCPPLPPGRGLTGLRPPEHSLRRPDYAARRARATAPRASAVSTGPQAGGGGPRGRAHLARRSRRAPRPGAHSSSSCTWRRTASSLETRGAFSNPARPAPSASVTKAGAVPPSRRG